MKRRKEKREFRPPSDDDIWLDDLHIACAKAAVRWLKQTINLERPIKSLTGPELKTLVSVIEGEWIKMVYGRLSEGQPPFSEDEKTAYAELLLGG